ncbi:MAG: NAD(+) kinase, partial [Chitinophagaceae bacterium]
MKAAIYSRVMEDGQQKDVQLFFDELSKQKIEPVIFQPFFEQIRNSIKLPSATKTFALSEDLTEEIEFIISLGGDGTLL